MELREIDTLTMSFEEAGKLLGIGRSSAYGAVCRGESMRKDSVSVNKRIQCALIS